MRAQIIGWMLLGGALPAGAGASGTQAGLRVSLTLVDRCEVYVGAPMVDLPVVARCSAGVPLPLIVGSAVGPASVHAAGAAPGIGEGGDRIVVVVF